MSIYRTRVLPSLIHAAMQHAPLGAYRARLTAGARGRVLEVGIGSGLNVPLYPAITRLVGLDPSAPLLARARPAAERAGVEVDLVEGSALAIPLVSGSIDTVVTSWTLCSVPDVRAALGEMRRVLAPGGQLLFVEHGLSPDRGVSRWQRLLTPVWTRLAGGCHLDRPVDRLVQEAGFRIERMTCGYMPGPRALTFMYEGMARPR